MSGFINYDILVDSAMREVVKRILNHISVHGIQGDHHVMISFDTNHPGVRISSKLKKQYTNEMTIILQYQYQDLFIGQDFFSVSLSFNRVTENIRIPFHAITYVGDPSVEFGLQFHDYGVNKEDVEYADYPKSMEDEGALDNDAIEHDEAIVVSLDEFRNRDT